MESNWLEKKRKAKAKESKSMNKEIKIKLNNGKVITRTLTAITIKPKLEPTQTRIAKLDWNWTA